MKNKQFEDFKNNLILKEIKLAKSEGHPPYVIKQLENLQHESNPRRFRKRYKKITGATTWDLSDEMLEITS